jgi:hypothetical protein
MRRFLGALVAAFFFLLAGTGVGRCAEPPQTPPAKLATSPSDTVPSSPTSPCASFDSRRLLAAHLVTGNAEPGRISDEDLRLAIEKQNLDLQFLVATVPEPRLGFDGTLEAMTRALESVGFLLDRHLLPWQTTTDRPSPDAHCVSEQPGVALFQRAHHQERDDRSTSPPTSPPTSPRRNLLLLYLVGESPISGVSKTALIRAVEDVQNLRRLLPPSRCLSCDEIRLVGPAFSGAVVSLKQVLDHFPTLSFHILSGRATNGAIRKQLEQQTPTRRVRYQATVIPDDALQTEFFCFLTETLGADEHDIALITESSTGYGQAVIASQAGYEPGPLPPHDRVFPASKNHKSQHCRRSHWPRLTLPVPLHVARIHTAEANKTTPQTKTNVPIPELLPSLQIQPLPSVIDDTLRIDVFPTFSPRTITIAERSLAHILSTIYAEKVRFVGIIATDIQDKLFLARQVRLFSPDVVLFTFESDILLTHPDARSYLKGMLVVSPYPLFTRNQQWSYPFQGQRQRIQFSSDADQGVYNATLALLGYSEQLIEYSQAAPGIDKPTGRPAIWISAIGNDTLFPLAFVKDYDADGYIYENKAVKSNQFEYRYSPYQQGSLNFLLLLMGFFGLWLSVGYFWHYYSTEKAPPILFSPLRFFRRSRIARSLFDEQLAEREFRRQPMFLLCLFVPAWVAYFGFTTVHFMQLRDGNLDEFLDERRLSLLIRPWLHIGHIGVYQNLSWKVLCIAAFSAFTQFVLTLTIADAFLLNLSPRWRIDLQKSVSLLWQGASRIYKRAVVSFGIFLVLVLVSTVFLLWTMFVNYLQLDFNHMLFLRRSAQPAFGLSPMMPLLLLGFGVQLFGYCELERIYLLEKVATVYLDLLEELEGDYGLRAKITEIANRLASPSWWEMAWGILLAVLQAATVLSELVTLEVAPLHFLFRFLIALQVATIGFVFYRFLRLWAVFREFLQQLGHHPLSQSLDRLPHKFIRSLGALFLEELPEMTRREATQAHFRMLVNHMEQLDPKQDLKFLPPADAQEIETLLEDLKKLSPELAREGTQRTTPVPLDVADAQVVRASRLVTRILKRFWRARPLPGSVTIGKPGEAQLAVRPGPDQNTVEAFERLLPDSLHLWLRLAEDFLAIQVVSYINRLFPHLRNGLLNVTVGFVLLLLSLIVYPFQPQRYLVLLSTVLLVVTGPGTMYVLAQMNRDEVLSRIAKSPPGKLTWDRAFVSQVVIYGVLPLVSLIATQFPEVRGAAFSWIETALKILK